MKGVLSTPPTQSSLHYFILAFYFMLYHIFTSYKLYKTKNKIWHPIYFPKNFHRRNQHQILILDAYVVLWHWGVRKDDNDMEAFMIGVPWGGGRRPHIGDCLQHPWQKLANPFKQKCEIVECFSQTILIGNWHYNRHHHHCNCLWRCYCSWQFPIEIIRG